MVKKEPAYNKKNKLTIYLFKSDESFENLYLAGEGVKTEKLENGLFVYKPVSMNVPPWVENFFKNKLECSDKFTTSYYQAAYLIRIDDIKRVFALTFGGGYNLLKQEKLEKRFGLITTLNTVPGDQVKTFDITTLNNIPTNSRIQSSKHSDVSTFGIDIEKDLVKSAGGKCPDERIATVIEGKTSLKLSNYRDKDDIEDFLKLIYDKFNSTEYKKKFEWIDHIKNIEDSTLVDELNNNLVKNLNEGKLDKIWMGPPEVVTFSNIKGYRYDKCKELMQELDIEELLKKIKFRDKDKGGFTSIIPDIDILKTKKIEVTSDTDKCLVRWPLLDCLYCEIERKGEAYILSSGLWYEIEKKYVDSINAVYNTIPISESIKEPLKNCKYKKGKGKDSGEGKYNKDLSSQINDSIVMDAQNIEYGGGSSKIELCDILRKGMKQFIHVKKYSSSSVLSHLFNQGLVSAELILNTPEFIEAANSKIEAQKDSVPDIDEYKLSKAINPQDCEITFCIITKKEGERPDIPFFSKIALKNVYNTLTSYRYKVTIGHGKEE